MENSCLKWPAYHCPALCLIHSAPRPDESLVGTLGYLDIFVWKELFLTGPPFILPLPCPVSNQQRPKA